MQEIKLKGIYQHDGPRLVPIYIGWLQYLESLGIYKSDDPNKFNYMTKSDVEVTIIDIRDMREMVYMDILDCQLNNYSSVLEMVISHSRELFSNDVLDFLESI